MELCTYVGAKQDVHLVTLSLCIQFMIALSGAISTFLNRQLANQKCCYRYAAGAYYNQNAGSDAQCLPKNPNWGRYSDGDNPSAYIYGAEYQLYFSVGETLHKKYNDYEVPCAVCQSKKRLNVHMIPAKDRCHSYGWHLEYRGYLMTQHYGQGASNYVCVDAQPDKIGSISNQNGRTFYPVESGCGSLPCPPYVKHRELTCANGAVYIRWGRTSCPSRYAAGAYYNKSAGSDTQCLPRNPNWRRYSDGDNPPAYIYGGEYQLAFSVGEALDKKYLDYKVPCALKTDVRVTDGIFNIEDT
ncbi:hypothetical protein KUTeg_021933 [Tegillarca granosa]|uniref:Short-chain collagen C4-like n=1 Tax=Tegillarca granosa TaxID=220873 RepID=A0ABQ9E506_TEGGR|nr:hypothetical protein KUTeg_021933 [Tegillarca granosa]